jgi:hypothetical protein
MVDDDNEVKDVERKMNCPEKKKVMLRVNDCQIL